MHRRSDQEGEQRGKSRKRWFSWDNVMNGFIKTALTEAQTRVASVSGRPLPTSRFQHTHTEKPATEILVRQPILIKQFPAADTDIRLKCFPTPPRKSGLNARLTREITLGKHGEQTAQKPEKIRKEQWWFYWKEGNKRKLGLKRAGGRWEIWKKVKQRSKCWIKRCDGSVCRHHTVCARVVKTRLAPSYRGGKSTLFSRFPRAPHKPRKMGAI